VKVWSETPRLSFQNYSMAPFIILKECRKFVVDHSWSLVA
jgi:hypothetical protein